MRTFLFIEGTCNDLNSLFPEGVRLYRLNRTRLLEKKILKGTKLMSCKDFE